MRVNFFSRLIGGLFFSILTFVIVNPLNAQFDEQVKTNDIVTQLPNDSLLIQKNSPAEMTSSHERTEVNKSNIIPVRKKFEFNFLNLIRGLMGILVLIFIAYLFSENRKAISWRIVGLGLLSQIILAIGILQVPFLQTFFEYGGKAFVKILDFTDVGTDYLFKSMVTGRIETSLQNFAITILPTIIFFSALTSVLFYFGIIQKVVWALAWVMTKVLKLSGPESLSVAGNIFIGQTESPLMIKAYLEKMSKSEMLLVMSGGMATLAGGVLAVYINFLGGDDPVQQLVFAKHLLTASVMAAPGVVVISKILVPQTEDISKEVKISQDRIGKNVLDAINNGTYEGLKLAVNVGAMLLVFLAFLAMINYFFLKIGDWTHINAWISNISSGRYDHLSLQFILGYSLSPLMWLIGISVDDITLVGSLLGEKIVMTEFVGYISLSEMKAAGAFSDPKSIIMATYMLCGFANIASVGIQIGGIGAIAPTQRTTLTRYGMKALLAGTLASLLSATIVGIILS
jgi:CNT family concentrative nucleoside transporter